MLTDEQRAEGWKPIAEAPMDGTRCRVGHTLDPNSMKVDTLCPTFGAYENSEWGCNNAFICVDGFLRWEPNAYRPENPHD